MATTQLSNTVQTERPEEPIIVPSHLDGVAYLYGHPLLNSLSPPLHHTIYNALGFNWAQLPLSKSYTSNGSSTYPPPYTLSPPVKKFLAHVRENPKFVGSSVTMPWKVAIMPHLDDLTEDARQAGACNTIFIRDDNNGGRKLVGTNTDCVGIREALLQSVSDGTNPFRNKPALIVGGGGTARAVIYTMKRWLGCSKIYIVNRDRTEIETILQEVKSKSASSNLPNVEILPISTVAEAQSKVLNERPEVIVSAIPNYPPKTPEEVTTRKIVEVFLGGKHTGSDSHKGVILEMCYHPSPWTDIAELASQQGWKVVLGSEALIWQGIEQAKLWTGKDITAVPGLVDKVKDVVMQRIAERMSSKSNI